MPLSYVQFIGDGVVDTYAISFPFISSSHITVKVDGQVKVNPDDFSVSGTDVIFVTPPADGLVVELRRETENTERLVDFEDASNLTEGRLDRSALQMFYLAQESFDAAADAVTYAEGLQLEAGSLPSVTVGDVNSFIVVSSSGTWVVKDPTATRTSLGLGTAALKNHGAGASDVPLNSNLPTFGTVATKDHGTTSGTVALLSTGGKFPISMITTGTTSGTIPVLTTGGKIPDSMLPTTALGEQTKAWVSFVPSATPTVTANLGVSSVVQVNTGRYTVNFTDAFSAAAAYAAIFCVEVNNSSAELTHTIKESGFLAGSCAVAVKNSAGSFVDPANITGIFMGELA